MRPKMRKLCLILLPPLSVITLACAVWFALLRFTAVNIAFAEPPRAYLFLAAIGLLSLLAVVVSRVELIARPWLRGIVRGSILGGSFFWMLYFAFMTAIILRGK